MSLRKRGRRISCHLLSSGEAAPVSFAEDLVFAAGYFSQDSSDFCIF